MNLQHVSPVITNFVFFFSIFRSAKKSGFIRAIIIFNLKVKIKFAVILQAFENNLYFFFITLPIFHLN